MHGVKKQKLTPEQEQKIKEKVDAYQKLSSLVLTCKASNDVSDKALHATTQLLTANPFFYTIWNYRRHILSSRSTDALKEELAFTYKALRINPKIYTAWQQRKWVITELLASPTAIPPSELFEQERGALKQIFQRDARNFHAWNHYRYINVVQHGSVSVPGVDLPLTQELIEQDFSNHSAWHQRRLAGGDDQELLWECLCLSPDDESLWQRWLSDPSFKHADEGVVEQLKELIELDPECTWPRLALVLVCKELGRLDTLDAQLETLIRLDPCRAGYYRELAK